MTEFNRGDIVVCVDVRPRSPDPVHVRALARLELGRLYTISRVLIGDGEPGVQLIDLSHRPGAGWLASRFRKLIRKAPVPAHRILEHAR